MYYVNSKHLITYLIPKRIETIGTCNYLLSYVPVTHLRHKWLRKRRFDCVEYGLTLGRVRALVAAGG